MQSLTCEACMARSQRSISGVGSSVVYGTMVLSKSISSQRTPREASISGVRSVSAGRMRSGMSDSICVFLSA